MHSLIVTVTSCDIVAGNLLKRKANILLMLIISLLLSEMHMQQTHKLEALRAKNCSPGPICPKAILESPSEQFLDVFYLQVTLILPIKCQVN